MSVGTNYPFKRHCSVDVHGPKFTLVYGNFMLVLLQQRLIYISADRILM